MPLGDMPLPMLKGNDKLFEQRWCLCGPMQSKKSVLGGAGVTDWDELVGELEMIEVSKISGRRISGAYSRTIAMERWNVWAEIPIYEAQKYNQRR